MNFNEYFLKAGRTRNPSLRKAKTLLHAVCGLVSETNEYYAALDVDERVYELGDCMWMCHEICYAYGFNMGEIWEEAQTLNPTDNGVQFNLDEIAAFIAGAVQKSLQGHNTRKNVKSLLAKYVFIAARDAEMVLNLPITAVLDKNIAKLENRYPEGFSEERSVNRDE